MQEQGTFSKSASREWLISDYQERVHRNGRFSIRAYAKVAGVNSGVMSQLLSRKRSLTLKQASKIAAALKLSETEREKFIGVVTRPQTATGATKTPYRVLKSDAFQLIADWYHYAILSLLETESPPNSIAGVAQRLGIQLGKARQAMRRLMRLGLLHRVDGRIVLDTEGLRTTEDVPSGAIRESHRQILFKATEALDRVDVHHRDASYVSFCCDPSRLPEAKRLIRQFRRQLTKVMEDGPKTQVYALSIHLFPLSHGDSQCEPRS